LKKNTIQAILVSVFDVRNRNEVFEAVKNIPGEWQHIDILINNAGLALGRDYFDEADIDDWDTMIDTNVKGLIYTTKALMPLLKKVHRLILLIWVR
jgi:NADP-dependent 3-hydroxy acid dehydrogenase YdfG